MPDWITPSKTSGRNAGKAEKSASWWQPMPSVWVSTSRMSASCCISTCPILPKPTFRKPDVPEETERKPMPSSYTPNRTRQHSINEWSTPSPDKEYILNVYEHLSTITKWRWATVFNVSVNSTWKSSAGSSNTFRCR